MRIRTVLSAAVLAALAAFPLAGVASAHPTTRDCRDFASQAAAESALRSGSGDPARLDPDGNGVACESYFALAVPGGPVPGGPVPGGPVRDGTVPAPAADPAPRAVVPAPVVAAPPDAVPADAVPADAAPGEADPAGSAPADAVPGGPPADAVPADAPADAVPSDAPADAAPADAALAGAPVRTVPEPQILVKPQGAPDTGDGSAAPLDATVLVLLAGGLGAVMAVGAGRRTS